MTPVHDVDAAIASTNQRELSTGVDRENSLSVLACILLALPGVLMLALIFGPRLFASDQVDDFTGFLIGAKLLGTAKLYAVQANLELQKQLVGSTEPRLIFVRLPFVAFAMKPFLFLPYGFAVFLWRGLLATALLAFIVMSKHHARHVGLAVCWSIPAAASLAISNDAPLILLFIGLSLACRAKGWHFAAGTVLGLCLAKFHFLIFLPLLLFRAAYRRELAGFASVAVVLLAINFAVQPDWIPLYWGALNLPQANMNPHAMLMPDLYASFFWTGHPGIGVIAGALVVTAALWPLCRRLPFDLAMPLCILGGLLVAPHTNYLDWILAFPAIFAARYHFAGLKGVTWFLLSPIAGMLCFPATGPQTIGPMIIVAASLWMLWAAVHVTSPHTLENRNRIMSGV